MVKVNMANTNIIKQHIMSQILKVADEKRKFLAHPDGFLYLNEIVYDGCYAIDRINKDTLYTCEEIIPISYRSIKGKALLQVLDRIKNNQIYFYKKVDGRFMKMRLKNGNTNQK